MLHEHKIERRQRMGRTYLSLFEINERKETRGKILIKNMSNQ